MRRPLFAALLAISATCPALACSGAFSGAPVDGGPASSAGEGSTVSEPPAGSGSEAGPSSPPTSTSDSGNSSSPPADAAPDAKAIADATTDGPCVEPEPNGSAAIPARLPVPFNCGRIDAGGDVDHFTYTAVAGDTGVRFTASPMDRVDALNVTVRRGGTTLVLGAGDTFNGLQAGTVVTFEVKATDNVALSYGIVIVR